MNETHDNALFIQPEEGVHDGCYLFVKRRCPVELAAYRERIEALPVEPSAWFTKMTADMAEIQDVPRPSVIDPTKGEDECKTTKSTTSLDQKLSTSGQPNQTANSKSITDSAQCLNGKRITDVAPVEI